MIPTLSERSDLMFPPMRRSKQQLDTKTCETILREEPRGVLSLIGAEGYPYGVPMNFVCLGGTVYFHTALNGHKLDAIKACPKASFCVIDKGEKPDGEWAYYFNSVIVFGTIRIVEDEEEKRLRLRELGLKYFPTAEEVESDINKNADRCHILALEIEHMTGKRVHER